MVESITTERFAGEVLDAEGIVLVDFWAEWCGPCKMFAPTFEEFSLENTDIRTFKANVDDEEVMPLAIALDIKSIPTLVAFKDGEVVGRFSGAVPKAALIKFTEEIKNKGN